LAAWFDSTIIDGLVDSIGSAPKRFGATLRPLQNGLVQFYALAMMLGLLILMGALLM
jgi:NADH-quinone oxidoreductase subunit L